MTARTARRWIFFAPVAVFAVLALYFGIGLTKDPSIIPSALIDKPAPAFRLADIPGRDGPGFSTDDLRQGRVSVVNVFASWCIPCRAEHPIINRLAVMGLVVVYGINYKDDPDGARRWLDQLGDSYTAVGADRDGRVGIDWGVYGVPETFVVDGGGTIRYRHVGPLTMQTLESKVLPVIKALGP